MFTFNIEIFNDDIVRLNEHNNNFFQINESLIALILNLFLTRNFQMSYENLMSFVKKNFNVFENLFKFFEFFLTTIFFSLDDVFIQKIIFYRLLEIFNLIY